MKYEILGHNMQSLKVTLNEGEKIYSDSGKLVSKSENVIMVPKMAGGIISAIERKMTGATALLTEFETKNGTGTVSVAGIIPGRIYQVTLAEGQEFAAEDHAFLAADSSVKFTIQTVSIGAAFFGGTGLVLQKFVGPGNVFLHIIGDILEYDLDGNDTIEIDPGHVAGFETTLSYKIRFVDNIRTMMFGGVGLFLAKFEGKGKLIAHSVSWRKFVTEIYTEGKEQEQKEGS